MIIGPWSLVEVGLQVLVPSSSGITGPWSLVVVITGHWSLVVVITGPWSLVVVGLQVPGP